MRIEFVHSRSPAYFRSHLRLGAMRKLRATFGTAGLLIVLGVATALCGAGDTAWIVAGAAAVAAAMLLVLLGLRRFEATVTVPPDWCAPRRYLLTDDTLESSTALTSARWSWPVVTTAEVTPDAYHLWQERTTMFDVPRAGLTADQDAELQAHLRERGLLR